jgi:hypothetical protein
MIQAVVIAPALLVAAALSNLQLKAGSHITAETYLWSCNRFFELPVSGEQLVPG